jgi:hypothetical protein
MRRTGLESHSPPFPGDRFFLLQAEKRLDKLFQYNYINQNILIYLNNQEKSIKGGPGREIALRQTADSPELEPGLTVRGKREPMNARENLRWGRGYNEQEDRMFRRGWEDGQLL